MCSTFQHEASLNPNNTDNSEENFQLNFNGDLNNTSFALNSTIQSKHFDNKILDAGENIITRELFFDSDDDIIIDQNYETEDSFDSDDSDIVLQHFVKKKRPVLKDTSDNAKKNENGEQKKDDEQILRKKSRKRQRNQNQWERNVTKRKRNTGQAYKTILNKKSIPERCLQAPCTDSCRYKCCSGFSQEERQGILEAFWKIGDNARQRQFISAHIIDIIPKYRYPKDSSKRSCNQSFFLPKNKDKLRVCKRFFMATLNIGDTMIRTTLKKKDANGIVEQEMRGKHGNHNKLDHSLIDGVKNHINSIPRIESHYLRNQTTREYFEGDLNITTLYRLYKEQCIQSGDNYVKKCIYERVFNSDFNIGFFKPKKDQCSTCETYKNSNEEEKRGLEESYRKHIREKEMSREEKEKDIKEATVNEKKVVAVYDLEAVLPTPCGEISSFYYKSKLATYNFTVFNIVPKQGYCYVWSENCAKRGANEIGTCVLSFLKEFCNDKSVTFYSDNCAGQNKNKFVAAMYSFATTTYNIHSITHKFLVTGHTQNEGDSMHSRIEQEKKRVLKGGPIYVPSQWIPVIRLAKKNGEPYKVFEMDTSDFFDMKALSNQIGPNYNVNTNGEKVLWNDIKILSLIKNAPYSIFYKLSYDQENYLEIDVRGRRSSRTSSCLVTLKQAYNEAPKISKNKKEGLLFLCKTKAIKSMYHSFYENLNSEN